MTALLRSELLKLRRSLVLLLTAAAPICVCLFAAIALATRPGGVRWERFLDEGLAMWSFFMLPMSITALTILIAQVEHGSRMWAHLLALPVHRSALFGMKLLVAFGLLLAMQLLVYVGLYLIGTGVGAALPAHQLSGDHQFYEMGRGMVAMAVGALPMLVIQLWIALRMRSFVTPLVLGIIGTFFALVITASGQDVYVPWLLQIYATMWPKPSGVFGVTLGAVGGIVLAGAMLADLTRREMRA